MNAPQAQCRHWESGDDTCYAVLRIWASSSPACIILGPALKPTPVNESSVVHDCLVWKAPIFVLLLQNQFWGRCSVTATVEYVSACDCHAWFSYCALFIVSNIWRSGDLHKKGMWSLVWFVYVFSMGQCYGIARDFYACQTFHSDWFINGFHKCYFCMADDTVLSYFFILQPQNMILHLWQNYSLVIKIAYLYIFLHLKNIIVTLYSRLYVNEPLMTVMFHFTWHSDFLTDTGVDCWIVAYNIPVHVDVLSFDDFFIWDMD